MRKILALAVGLALAAGLSGYATASPPPGPATVNHNGIVVPAPPGSGLLPIGRTSAGAVPTKPPREVPAPTRPAQADGRPYGSDVIGGQIASNPNQINQCSASVATRNSAGSNFVMTAGHCATGVSPSTGKWYYPWNTATTFSTAGQRSNRDSTGDHAAIRHNTGQTLYRQVRQVDTGAIYTLTGAGNPTKFENASAVMGFQANVLKGWVSNAGPANITYGDCNCVIGNQGIMTLQLTTSDPGFKCGVEGDSGSPILAGLDIIGIYTGHVVENGLCYLFFDRIGSTLGAYGPLFLAPAPPA